MAEQPPIDNSITWRGRLPGPNLNSPGFNFNAPGVEPLTRWIHIHPTAGSDSSGNGGPENPYKTINKAYSTIDVVPATIAGQITWAREKCILSLAPGIYTEDVVTGFRRARIMIAGDGVQILGSIKHEVKLADFPFGGEGGPGFYEAANNPFPWTGGFISPMFEIQGVGGGIEGGFVTQNIQIQGEVQMVYDTIIGSGWQARFANQYFMADRVQFFKGYQAVGTNVDQSVTVELNDCSIQGDNLGCNNLGGEGGSLRISLKVANSQLKSTIGPEVIILEIDNCRVLNIDRNFGGFAPAGVPVNGVSCPANVSYSGITDCAFAGSLYELGKNVATGAKVFTMDANSFNALQARPGIDLGGGITYNLIDDAPGLGYTPLTTGDWGGAGDPTNVQDALDRMSATVAGVHGAIP